jgi:hypothetical protein
MKARGGAASRHRLAERDAIGKLPWTAEIFPHQHPRGSTNALREILIERPPEIPTLFWMVTCGFQR